SIHASMMVCRARPNGRSIPAYRCVEWLEPVRIHHDDATRLIGKASLHAIAPAELAELRAPIQYSCWMN
ncbi:hypothetical protein SB816_33200, partial [Achromobacter sp. SIMBA_011]|uniref:hypothetical protein n=1 Tax=Achromobacter sp. SIMBA_011 TaxID=3085759 RepID=UPI0039784220